MFDIRINAVPSNFFGYVINSSRVYWRKELEYNFDDKSVGEAEAYREKHKFDIEGEGLTAEEVAEQKRNLINKIFTIGYMLHRYKSPSRAWAPQAMDNKIGEDGECNGRSGKSFMFKALSYFMKTVKLSGRNPKLMDNPHVFDQVNQHTDFILVDDCDRYLNTGLFYDIITSDMTVNPKITSHLLYLSRNRPSWDLQLITYLLILIRLRKPVCCIWYSPTTTTNVRKITTTGKRVLSGTTSAKICFLRLTAKTSGTPI